MKKTVFFLVLIITLAIGLTSCAGTSHTSNSPSNGQHSNGCH